MSKRKRRAVPAVKPLCIDKKITVRSEQELIRFVKEYNRQARNEKPLNLKYLLRRYREIKNRFDTRAFMKEHDCRHCFYYSHKSRCISHRCCPDDLLQEAALLAKAEMQHCMRDITGDCPYANESGGCFGFCMRDILHEKEVKDDRPFGENGLF